MATLRGDVLEEHTLTLLVALEGHTLTLLVRFFRKVRSTRNRRCVYDEFACMNADEARGVCKDRSWWRTLISAYPHVNKA